MLTPKASPLLKKSENRLRISDIDFLLKTIIERELLLVRATAPLRKEIQGTKPYYPPEIFRLIDLRGRDSISYQE